MDPSRIIICKCENVTLKELIEAIDNGLTDLETLKRFLRIGMGPCQGLYCIPLIARELMIRTGKSFDEIFLPVNRPPINPVQFKYFIKINRVVDK
uniref:(2Fe-2S)-binding protein n=1 Tax=Staphylothermus marinus TaxID=2280 RepID=A0A7C4H9N3_STAMA